jgi:hypothetical protein
MEIVFASTEPLNLCLRATLDQPCADIRSPLCNRTCRANVWHALDDLASFPRHL